MRNIFESLALWQIQYSDYSVDMRKSIPEQEMWPSDLFWVTAAACAPSNVISRSSQSRLSRRERRHTDATGVDPVTPNEPCPKACQIVPNSAARSRRSASTGEKVHIPLMGLDALISYKPWFGARPRITLDEECPPELAQRTTPH